MMNSIEYAVAIPFTSIHSKVLPQQGVRNFYIGDTEKLKIGSNTVEVINLFSQSLQVLSSLIEKLSGSVDAVGAASTGTLSLITADLVLLKTSIDNIKTSIDSIKAV